MIIKVPVEFLYNFRVTLPAVKIAVLLLFIKIN